MLTNLEYNNLWVNPYPNGFNMIGVVPPNYFDFVIRENMLEDYLDIFRGFSTRAHRIIPGGVWYYDHPFFDANGILITQLQTGLKIKYILIGEACPDGGANYFYDINQIENQGYLNSIYNATYCGVGPGVVWAKLTTYYDKIDKLIDLAKRGVFFLDLFPFALNYDPLRGLLIINNVTDNFWNNPANHYNIHTRLTALNGYVEKPKVALAAPPKISNDIANKIHTGHLHPTPIGFTIDALPNFVTPRIPLVIFRNYWLRWPKNTLLNGIFHKPSTVTLFPNFKCNCYSGAGTVPHSLFIENAFI
jgi:hypothetical protein